RVRIPFAEHADRLGDPESDHEQDQERPPGHEEEGLDEHDDDHDPHAEPPPGPMRGSGGRVDDLYPHGRRIGRIPSLIIDEGTRVPTNGDLTILLWGASRDEKDHRRRALE